MRRSRALTGAALFLASACSSTPGPLPGGPPPEYETPRPFPVASASASAPEPAAAPALPFGSVDKLGAEVDAYMAGFGSKWGEAYAPSGVVVVAVHGEPVLVRAYGKADRDKGTPPTIATRFRVGSLTKQFTAAATLKLADAGAIDLRASVRTYIPELPDSYKDVTIDTLLHQTSGVPSYTDDPAILARSTEDVPSSDMIAWFQKHAPTFEAGTKWAYSNSNYYLLALVVERAAKEPFEAYLSKAILAPAGMKTASSSLAPGPAAVGYMRTVADALAPARVVSSAVPFGAGFLVASANDLLAWDRALAGTGVLSDAEKKRMFTVGREHYAMGWLVMPIQGTEVEWHNGAIDGFGSFFARAPEKDLSVVLLSNVFEFDATAAGQAVLSMALGGPAIPPVVERAATPIDEAFAKSLTGDYVISKETKAELLKKLGNPDLVDAIEGCTIAFDGGRLTAHPVGQGTFALRRAADGTLFNSALGVELHADFGAKKPAKSALGFSLTQGGLEIAYVRGKLPAKPKKGGSQAPAPASKKPAHEPAGEKPAPKKK